MVEKLKGTIKKSIDAIGIREFIKAYVLLAVFWLFIFMIKPPGEPMLSGGMGMSLYYIIATVTFPFSLSLFNLLTYFFFGNMMLFGSGLFWYFFIAIKYMVLFLFAPFFAFIFIILITLTSSVNKWIVKYENRDKSN